MNYLWRDQFFLLFLIFMKKKSLFSSIFLALSWLLRTASLIEFASGDIHWSWWILWMQDLGVQKHLFFFYYLSLWHYGNKSTLYSKLNSEWFCLTYCTATCQSMRMPMTIIGKDIQITVELPCPVPSYLPSYHSICFLIYLLLNLNLTPNEEPVRGV